MQQYHQHLRTVLLGPPHSAGKVWSLINIAVKPCLPHSTLHLQCYGPHLESGTGNFTRGLSYSKRVCPPSVRSMRHEAWGIIFLVKQVRLDTHIPEDNTTQYQIRVYLYTHRYVQNYHSRYGLKSTTMSADKVWHQQGHNEALTIGYQWNLHLSIIIVTLKFVTYLQPWLCFWDYTNGSYVTYLFLPSIGLGAEQEWCVIDSCYFTELSILRVQWWFFKLYIKKAFLF